MKYYSAVVNEDEIAATTLFPPYNILASYHYFKNKIEVLKKSIDLRHDLFIDSGAFSAANSGKEINIDEYCTFLKEVNAVNYASLDVLGNAEETMKNYKYMVEKHNLKPIPTFHMGSPITALREILALNPSYIALGGLVFSPGIENHCDEVWSVILSEAKGLRVHGFGLTNIELMKRYPWYSVDSSSFKSCKRFGRQGIIYNDFEFSTFSEDEYLEMLKKQGYEIPEVTAGMPKEEITKINKKKWFIYDFNSAQSYKLYAAYLTELNKTKDFSYLTAQTKLFS